MKFHQLIGLPFDSGTDIIDLDAITALLPNTPFEVAKQLYSFHGRKDEFQKAYGRLNISDFQWKMVTLPAFELCAASTIPPFRKWFESVGKRSDKFVESGWSCIDSRIEIVEYWEKHATWMRPPIFLNGHLVAYSSDLHLVEGHTRVGLLAGLIKRGILSHDSTHRIFLGAYHHV